MYLKESFKVDNQEKDIRKMNADEIKEFSNLWAFHPPTAIGTFLLFAIIYRSKFFASKDKLINPKANTKQ